VASLRDRHRRHPRNGQPLTPPQRDTLPSETTVYRWLAEKPVFGPAVRARGTAAVHKRRGLLTVAAQHARVRARETAAERFADEMIQSADSVRHAKSQTEVQAAEALSGVWTLGPAELALIAGLSNASKFGPGRTACLRACRWPLLR
jgi:hypothetical protein